MIIFSNKEYVGYIELFYDIVHRYDNKELFKILKGIPPSKVFFVKAALQEKFKRKFTFKEVKKIIKDKTWQWRTASSQTSNIKEESVSVSR